MGLIRWQHASAETTDSLVRTPPPCDLFADAPVSDEEMIGLWQRLIAVLPRKSRITLGVIASAPGEGVSTIVRGLARVVARNPNMKVLICELFGAGNGHDQDSSVMSPSVVDLVFSRGRIERSNTVHWLAGDRVAMGSLGDASWLNSIATDAESVRSIVAALSAHFELVILDLPPLSHSVASPAFGSVLDGVLLVVEAERTQAHAVRAARDALCLYGGNVVGVVLNKRRLHGHSLLRRGMELVRWPR